MSFAFVLPALSAPALSPFSIRSQTQTESAAEESFPIDLQSALRLAGANDLEIAYIREKLAEAVALEDLEFAGLLPVLSFGADWLKSEGQRQETQGAILTVSRQSAFAGARAELTLDLSDSIFQLLAAKQQVRAREFEVEAVRQQRLFLAALRYYALVEAAGETEIAADAVRRAESLVRQAESLAERGVGLQVEAARAMARLAAEKQRLLASQSHVRVSSADLAVQLRLDPQVRLVPAEGQIEPLTFVDPSRSLDALLEEAHAQRPDLMAAAAREEEQRYRRRAARWNPFLPEVVVFGEGGGLGGGTGSQFSQFDERENYGALIRWTWRGFGAGEFADMRRTDARYRQSAIEYEQLADAIQFEVLESWDRFQTARASMEAAQEEVRAASQSLTLDRSRLKAGVGLQIEVIQAEEAFTQAQISYLRTVVAQNQAQFAVQKSLGRLGESAPGNESP